ncbi:hypothetical protein HYC85_009568 [Camellia sinensis]|uniref:NAD(P)H dehydrogenase (quinone) n=1 Tax=Camellia sinensis TaxID=4442 RepID=A0A7J7HI10_CAMSI|nr:hypothetical protein HYC85_009568 [Camellia sinensis]
MGKGGGCVPSKKRSPLDAPDHDLPHPIRDSSVPIQNQNPSSNAKAPVQDGALQLQAAVKRTKLRIFIVFYSMYGHVEFLARSMKKGVDGIDGAEGVLYRVPETLSPEALEQMKVPPKGGEIPVISVEELVEADGLLFGFPTRYGCMSAQMKAFFDSTGRLWEEQKLAGVPAGFFVSTGTQGGGQETTIWTAITQLAHHGMLYVPIGYTFGAGMFKMDSIRGGSPYGAGVFSGDGTREPSETELALAEHQGKYMAMIVKRFALLIHVLQMITLVSSPVKPALIVLQINFFATVIYIQCMVFTYWCVDRVKFLAWFPILHIFPIPVPLFKKFVYGVLECIIHNEIVGCVLLYKAAHSSNGSENLLIQLGCVSFLAWLFAGCFIQRCCFKIFQNPSLSPSN